MSKKKKATRKSARRKPVRRNIRRAAAAMLGKDDKTTGTMESLVARGRAHSVELRALLERVTAVGDRVFGGTIDRGEAKESSPRAGIIGAMQDEMDVHGMIVTLISEKLERLEAL